MGTKEAAQGRWRDILASLGVPTGALRKKAQACPMCGGTDRFVFDDRHGNGDYFCRQCGAGDGFGLLQKLHGWDFMQALREVERVIGDVKPNKKPMTRVLMDTEVITKLWQTGKPIMAGDPVDAYLCGRGISLPSWPKAIRFADRWKHSPSQKYLPCMFAMFRSANGEIGTIHRTYLAPVIPRRMFLPAKIPVGGAIQLFAPAETMGVAEGIETALSAALLFKMPVWATTSERLLRDWQPPPGARNITIFADNDANYVGHAAAYHCANRLALRKGYRVRVMAPDGEGNDWNDVLKEQAHGQLAMSQLRTSSSNRRIACQPISDAN